MGDDQQEEIEAMTFVDDTTDQDEETAFDVGETSWEDKYACKQPGCLYMPPYGSQRPEASLKRHTTRSHSQTPSNGSEGSVALLMESSEPGGELEERRPEVSKPAPAKNQGLFGRLRQKPAPAEGERKPTVPRPRRVSTQAFWGDLTEGAAGMVGQVGFVPMARAMEWSSPVAGEIIEEATKNTIVDKPVQLIVRNTEKWQDLFDLVGFWAAIGMAQAQPEKAPMALKFARKRLVNLLPRIATNIAKQRKKEKAAAEALSEIMPDLADLGLKEGDDPVKMLLDMLFAPPEGFAQPEPEPAVA